jgi:PAS domain S-box-containing protein
MMKAHDSEHKRLRRTRAEELRARIRANVAIGELASELAHHLNNPLEALTNLIYLAKAAARDEQLQAILDDAESQLARVSTVVRSILMLKSSDPQQRLQAAGKILSPEAFRQVKDEYESALHLASIVEGAQDAIYSKKLDGTIMAWNPEAEHLFGYASSEALGKSVRMLIPHELMQEEWEILAQVKAGRRVAHYQTIRKTKDGNRVRVSISISPIHSPSGKVVGASTIAREIPSEESL